MEKSPTTDVEVVGCREVASICSVCNTGFSFVKHDGRRGRNRTVCDSCKSSGIKHKQHKIVCQCCGIEFGANRVDAKFCSHACAKKVIGNANRIWPTKEDARRHAEHTRRLRISAAKSEKFTYKEIFERDGYVCGICGKKTKTSKSAPRDYKPSLDHIVPISKGGSHTRENVQCSHWICNSRKSWVGGGQMKLGFVGV